MSVTVTLKFFPNQEVSLVEVAGSFNNWTRVAMTRHSGRSGEWTISLKVEPGQHAYKYIVDQEWRYDPGQPTTNDNMGGLNNIITVSAMPHPADDNMAITTLNPERKHEAIELSENNLEASSNEDTKAFVQATHDIQYSNKNNHYYFEVKVISGGSNDIFYIGLSGNDYDLSRAPGWDDGTYGYHGDDGNVFNGKDTDSSIEKRYGPTYSTGDTVGCGINLTTGIGFYTKNGQYLGKAFCVPNVQEILYPTFGIESSEGKFEVNFGRKPFVFDQQQSIVIVSDGIVDKNCLCQAMPPISSDNMAGEILMMNPERKNAAIELSENNLQAYCNEDDTCVVQAKNDIHYFEQTNHYYFEMKVLSGGPKDWFIIGLESSDDYEKSRAPGLKDGTYGYHGDDGNIFNGKDTDNRHGKRYGPTYSTGDTVGCGINLSTGIGFYTKNGEHLGKAFSVPKFETKLYPTFGISKCLGGKFEVNLGMKPFVFDQQHMCKNCLCQVMPPPANDNMEGVLSTLNPDRKCGAIELSKNNLQASSEFHVRGVVQSTHDIQHSNNTSHYYFEMKVISGGPPDTDETFHIGLAIDDCDLSRAPGWDDGTYGYHGDDGNIFNGKDTDSSTGKLYGPTYSTGDTVGCGINLKTGIGFYTKNGEHLGKAFSVPKFERKLYPTFGINCGGGTIEVNLGRKPFVFGAKDGKSGEMFEEDVEFLVKTTNKSEKQIKDYYRLFKIRYPTGRIDMKEFIKMTKDFITFIAPSSEIQCDPIVFCNYAFKSYDTDENGFISFREAARAMYINREDGPKEEKIKFAFRMYDINKNGAIEQKELIDWVIGIMGFFGQKEGGKLSKEDIEKDLKEMIALIATSKDGFISEEEFTKACNKDEEVFDNLCRYPEFISQILKADLKKFQWKQEMEEMKKDFEELDLFQEAMAAFT